MFPSIACLMNRPLAFAGAFLLGLACSVPGARAQALQDALVSAYLNNPQLQADRARQRATDEDVSRAWGGLRPQVVLSGEKGRAIDKIVYPGNVNTNYQPITTHDARGPEFGSVQVKQEIWDGNRTLWDVSHARWAVDNGLAILQSTEQNVLGDALQSYYDLYRDEKILQIQDQYVKSLEEERKGTLARYRVKDVTQTDVAQAEARLARGIADRQQYAGNVEASRSSFLRATGLPPGHLPEPPPYPASLPQSLEEAVGLVENNPDLMAAIYAERAAEADVGIVESGLLPDISLQAQSSHSSLGDTNLSNNYGAQVTLNVSIPLYDGGVASARTRSAKHTAGQRRLEIDLQRDKVIDSIKRDWQNLVATQARIASLKENARAANIALIGVQQEQRVGSRTIIDELNAQQEVLDTEIALSRSQHDEAIVAYSLLVACGRLTVKGLQLPVEKYDPVAHYDGVRWLPWGPWIGTDYPDGPETPGRLSEQ